MNTTVETIRGWSRFGLVKLRINTSGSDYYTFYVFTFTKWIGIGFHFYAGKSDE